MSFVKGFSHKTFSFIKTSEFEMTNLKSKVNRDLTQQSRETEDRIKAFKTLGDQSIQAIRDDTETKMTEMNDIV